MLLCRLGATTDREARAMNAKPATNGENLVSVLDDARTTIQELRRSIRAITSKAVESNSYRMAPASP